MYEAYSVGVRIGLIDGVTAPLLLLSRAFGKTTMAAKALNRELDSIKRWALTGAIMSGAGLAILAGFKPALDQAKQFQQELTKFKLYGMGDEANLQAEKFVKSMNVMGSSYVDNMRLMTEAQGIFRESGKLTTQQQLEGAKIATPILAKLAVIESSLSPDERGRAHSQDLAMLRFIESRGGANDPRRFAEIADWGYRLSKSSGGVVDWPQLQQMMATLGPLANTLSESGITKLEPVIADLKGGRTGSGMRTSFQRLLGTQRGLPRQAVAELLGLGLWDPSKVELTGGGGVRRFIGDPGDVLRDRVKFATDPVAFYTQNFLPAIGKKYGAGILGDDDAARIKRAAEIAMVFGPGTAGAVFTQIDKLLPAISRSEAAQGKQVGINGSYDAAGATLSGKQLFFMKAWDNLMEQTGEQILPLAVQGLSALLPILTDFSKWAQANPKLFGDLVRGIAGLGVALVAGGVLVELVAFGKALSLIARISWTVLVPGLKGLGSGVSALAKVAWPVISGGASKVVTALGDLSKIPFLGMAAGLAAFAAASKAASDYIDDYAKKHDQWHNLLPKAFENSGPFGPFGGAGAVVGQNLADQLLGGGRKSMIHPSSYRGGATAQPIVLQVDGRTSGQVTARHLANGLNGSPAGGADFDWSANFGPAGLPLSAA